jgi:predicted Zn-dependent protease
METKYTLLIERHFDGELSTEETSEVQRLNETDAEFQKEFQLFEKANRAIKLLTIKDLKEEIKAIHQSEKFSNEPKKSSFGFMKIAASIMLIAMVGIGFYSQNYSNQNLYEENYAPVDDYITNMDPLMTEMEKAMELFNKQDYNGALEAFASIERAEPLNQEAKFYFGQSLLNIGENDQAITTLSEVTGSYRAEALWYAALTQLKTSKEEDAKATLNKITSEKTDTAFVLKAERLLNKLNSPLRKLVF